MAAEMTPAPLEARVATADLVVATVAAVKVWADQTGRVPNRRFFRDLIWEYWERPTYPDNGGFSHLLLWSPAARSLYLSRTDLPPGERNKGLARDHVVPLKTVLDILMHPPMLDRHKVLEILTSNVESRVVTMTEHGEITRRTNRHGIDPQDRWAHYEAVGLAQDGFRRLVDDLR